MYHFLFRRLLIAIPVLFGITVGTFALIAIAPGDPLLAYASLDDIDLANLDAARERLGLKDPLPVQYARWLGNVLQGNLGRSLVSQVEITEIIGQRLGNTLRLTVISLVATSIAGVIIGVVSALHQYSLLDYTLTIGSLVGLSVPSFFTALVLIFVFAIQLNLLPTSGLYSLTLSRDASSLERFIDGLRYYILPVVALSAGGAASLARYTRSGMLEIRSQAYLVTAQAKGLRNRRVTWRHAIPNAMLPIITLLMLRLPAIFGGSVIVEYIFGWPGIGSLSVKAANDKDYPLILALTLIYSVLVLAASILADILYAVFDPRVRYE